MIRHSRSGFTLIEVLTVVVIILIIAGWVISSMGSATRRAAEARTKGEIQSLSAACENYKADNGDYPRAAGVTEGQGTGPSPIDPRQDADSSSPKYRASSLALYKMLSGDANADTEVDNGAKAYIDFKEAMKTTLGGNKNPSGVINPVLFLQDAFGNSYGYCTAAAKLNEERRNGQQITQEAGFNSTFDLWSTGGQVKENDRARWFRNW